MTHAAEVSAPKDWEALAHRVDLHVEADLRIDSPFGPLHLRTETGGQARRDTSGPARARTALVIGIDGWGSLLRLSWSALFGALRPGRALLRTVATASGAPIYLDAGSGPRLRIARPAT